MDGSDVERDAKTFIAIAPRPTARDRGVLTVTSGTDVGRVIAIPVSSEVTLGRSEECSHPFDDGSLSRVHSRVVWMAGAYLYEDKGSTNGSWINDARVETPTILKDGDRLRLGSSISMRFSLVSAEEEQALTRVFEGSMRDGLTGVFNRKHLDERLEAEVAYATRHGAPLAVVMVDIDHFKRINDTMGHPAGDAVLRHIGMLLKRSLRAEDVAGRYGGEEFMLVLRGITLDSAVRAAERLRGEIASAVIEFESRPIAVTVSMGVASLACCGTHTDAPSLVKVADGRLYGAKQAGRNRVVAAG